MRVYSVSYSYQCIKLTRLAEQIVEIRYGELQACNEGAHLQNGT